MMTRVLMQAAGAILDVSYMDGYLLQRRYGVLEKEPSKSYMCDVRVCFAVVVDTS